jgi:starvation-inducible outer membrane lipoprotein
MNKLLLCCIFFACAAVSFAQKETFDMVTYTAPKNWIKEVTENIISYTIQNSATKNWCRINIVKSTSSKGSIDQDFESEWQALAVKSYNITEAPLLNEVQEADGWKIKTGGSKFITNNSNAMVLLTTASGYGRCASIITTTNYTEYIKDIEALLASVDLIKPENVSQQTAAVNENAIIGTWDKTGSVNPSYHDAYATSIAGYSSNQYTFNSNGTYYFVSKTFGMSFSKIFLIKENGTYLISGSNITLTPQKSVLEAWSKKDGVDKWGSLLSSQKRTLEKVTYQFTKHYFSGIQEWNFVLQADKATQRDGPHSNNTTFSNAWYYKPVSSNNPIIQLPNGQKITTEEIKKEPVQQKATTINAPFMGTWVASESDNSNYRVKNGVMSTIWRQYTFNANGTYSFYSKAYDPLMDKTLLGKENGTYQISENNIIINPQKSVLEAWSKIANRDEWGKKLNTQNIPLEKTTYQFTKIYADVMKRWELVLQTSKETKRDGHFSTFNNFNNAYYYPVTALNNKAIELPE